jgi:hypothetical protein
VNESDDPTAVKSCVIFDPTTTHKDGDTLQFEFLARQIVNPTRFQSVNNWDYFEGAVLAVTFRNKTHAAILGSAVLVAPGVALSAAHVVQEHEAALRSGDVTLACVGIASHGAQPWQVDNITYFAGTDICLFALRYIAAYPPSRTFYQASITTRLPAVGEPLSMVGFKADSDYFERGDDLGLQMLLSSGKVTASYPQGRGTNFKPWPQVQVDCPLPGGMSGGPVFDPRGCLVGISSASWEFGEDEEPAPAFPALIWPILGQPFPVLGLLQKLLRTQESKSLLDLNSRGLCRIERPDAIQLSQHGTILRTAYQPWP